MNRSIALAAFAGILSGSIWMAHSHVIARDHGQIGETWAVSEPDMMTLIKARLETAKANGQLDALNREFVAKAKAKVMRPVPVSGIGTAIEDKSWTYDPSIILENDIADHKGQMIARAGQRYNPLDHVALSQDLLFINGDNTTEIKWALAKNKEKQAKIIFVKGAPFDAMKTHQTRFYFDQKGDLTGKFGISATPALVTQQDDHLIVREIALRSGG